jgi:hypothetical protein
MPERIDTKVVLADMRATKRDLQGESPAIMTIPFNRLNRWIAALAQEIADREALEDVARDVVADLTRSRFILVQEDGTRNDATDLESVQRLAALREEE